MYNAKKYILEKDCVILVEGQFDCITSHRFGYNNVVALGGANFSKYHFSILKRYTDNFIFLLAYFKNSLNYYLYSNYNRFFTIFYKNY